MEIIRTFFHLLTDNIFTIILVVCVIHIFIITPRREHEKEMKTLDLIFGKDDEESDDEK